MMQMELISAVKLAIFSSGVFLWIGMLTGVWKYVQISRSEQARAHYYVDIAHRSSLLYAPATLILAVLAHFAIWSAQTKLILVVLSVAFFAFSIVSYMLHGWLKDTTNQFRQPHQLGSIQLSTWLIRIFMLLLIIAEIGSTSMLLWGVAKAFWA